MSQEGLHDWSRKDECFPLDEEPLCLTYREGRAQVCLCVLLVTVTRFQVRESRQGNTRENSNGGKRSLVWPGGGGGGGGVCSRPGNVGRGGTR